MALKEPQTKPPMTRAEELEMINRLLKGRVAVTEPLNRLRPKSRRATKARAQQAVTTAIG